MHSIFYRIFPRTSYSKAACLILAGAASGLFPALLVQWIVGPDVCLLVMRGLRLGKVSLLSQIICGQLPLLVAAVLWCTPARTLAAAVPAALSSFLLCFSAVLSLQIPGSAGLILLLLLCLGRCLALVFLYWFIMRQFVLNGRSLHRDLMWSAALTAVVILVVHWMVEPAARTVLDLLNT